MSGQMLSGQEVLSVTREHYFVVSPTAYGRESCACGWRRDGWDALPFEVHLAERLGLLTGAPATRPIPPGVPGDPS
jgi:hypothetical protein